MADFDPLIVWFPKALQFLRRSRELKSQGYVVSFIAVMRDRHTEFGGSGNGRARATADIIRLIGPVSLQQTNLVGYTS